MNRSVPLWAVLLGLILSALGTIGFGFAVKSTMAGSDRTGKLGQIAVEIASFPSTSKTALQQLASYATGNYLDEAIRIQRPEMINREHFIVAEAAPGLDLPGVLVRRNHPKQLPGWRVITGAFQIGENVQNAALLLSSDQKIFHKWVLSEAHGGQLQPAPQYRKLVHGMDILRDGSLIVTFDGGVSLQRVGFCGESIWSLEGHYNHSVVLDDEHQALWTHGDQGNLVKVSVADGSVLKTITPDAVIARNPAIDILEIRREHSNDQGRNSRNTQGKWAPDPFHFNDVEPLPADIASAFEAFHTGDLLVSSRSLNLLMVLDPKTLVIKWWRSGLTQRQHDPDWHADGTISVLNNRMSRDYSEILRVDPRTMQKSVVVDGREHDFYTRIRGKHQFLPDGSLIVTSPQQGRVFELDQDGELLFELLNTKPGDLHSDYVVTEMKWLPPDYFQPGFNQCQSTE